MIGNIVKVIPYEVLSESLQSTTLATRTEIVVRNPSANPMEDDASVSKEEKQMGYIYLLLALSCVVNVALCTILIYCKKNFVRKKLKGTYCFSKVYNTQYIR